MSSDPREHRLQAITGADTPEELRAIREVEQARMLQQLSTTSVHAVSDSLTEMHDALIVKALKLAEDELARLGLGAPPVPYAYLLFGSGGRSEQTFYSDQDSGIAYASPASETQSAVCSAYFSVLADTVVRLLIELGYPPCEGNVISSNAEWCLSLGEWESKIDRWFEEPSWEHVRYLLIFADGRVVGGDHELARKLKNRFFSDMLQSPIIARRMLENTLRHKVLVGVFGQLLTEPYGENAGSLDIKYGAYIPMVNVFRLLAVKASIRHTSTLDRIAALADLGILGAREAEEAAAAFTLLLNLRLQTAVKSEGTQWIGSGKLPKERLTKDLTKQLKKALKLGRNMQRRLERQMKYDDGR